MTRQRSIGVGSFLFAFLLFWSAAFADDLGSAAGKLSADLSAALDAAGPGEKVPVYFVLGDQLE
ncbi:MAG: hypothetical protein MUE47_10085, partial [Acidobacteria bacterium]|nr:hypothetical protein [Acidobacteriota bacterium]